MILYIGDPNTNTVKFHRELYSIRYSILRELRRFGPKVKVKLDYHEKNTLRLSAECSYDMEIPITKAAQRMCIALKRYGYNLKVTVK